MREIKSANHPINRHRWSFAQKVADDLASFSGSWEFITLLILFIIGWTLVNVYEVVKGFDPYPFIFLNLLLAVITAILAPVILMSQNREAQRDRLRAEYDYELNKKAEKEIQEIKRQLDRIERKLK